MYDYVFLEFNLHLFDMDINFNTNISKPWYYWSHTQSYLGVWLNAKISIYYQM